MKHLRCKIENNSEKPEVLTTVGDVGYDFAPRA